MDKSTCGKPCRYDNKKCMDCNFTDYKPLRWYTANAAPKKQAGNSEYRVVDRHDHSCTFHQRLVGDRANSMSKRPMKIGEKSTP
ncbi:predicted protein [Histoplasma mississippiense (nom. inval.)]|uniref:predicted protein n=1 Tax=Ajellomyces capsulatus (strain NAm1 / WU24) TaxID=2059318 RepID=UPI000157C947|nr:predicted protein [Histoplasma mississippiense (nom. inval.)]EDN09662.1 predicted protein [Histoplasma mississippiense (nom. inval.)]